MWEDQNKHITIYPKDSLYMEKHYLEIKKGLKKVNTRFYNNRIKTIFNET